MKYWVIKTNPKKNDLQTMIVFEKEEKWRTKKKIPAEIQYGDVLFIWASSPQKNLVGIAIYLEEYLEVNNNNFNRFSLKYMTDYFDSKLDINTLRSDKKLCSENTPSFLKSGPSGTVFPLTKQQGIRLTNLLASYISDLTFIWANDLNTEQHENTGRTEVFLSRIIRDGAKSLYVKVMYGYKCQVCGITLKIKTGKYAEGAHIKALGKPHNGPDETSNILCLCPNHHVLFDKGGFYINDDFSLTGAEGNLTVSPSHNINLDFIKYHRMNDKA